MEHYAGLSNSSVAVLALTLKDLIQSNLTETQTVSDVIITSITRIAGPPVGLLVQSEIVIIQTCIQFCADESDPAALVSGIASSLDDQIDDGTFDKNCKTTPKNVPSVVASLKVLQLKEQLMVKLQ